MTRMWAFEGTEGWWKAHGWKELGHHLHAGVFMVLLEHEESVDVERALYGEEEEDEQ